MAKSQTDPTDDSDNAKGRAINRVYYPVQIDSGKDRTRLLYFSDEAQQKEIFMLLLNAQGFTSQFDQFGFVKTLGDGASGQVILVQHKSTSERFAMKIIPTPSHT